jgi:hypothetical protein
MVIDLAVTWLSFKLGFVRQSAASKHHKKARAIASAGFYYL